MKKWTKGQETINAAGEPIKAQTLTTLVPSAADTK